MPSQHGCLNCQWRSCTATLFPSTGFSGVCCLIVELNSWHACVYRKTQLHSRRVCCQHRIERQAVWMWDCTVGPTVGP